MSGEDVLAVIVCPAMQALTQNVPPLCVGFAVCHPVPCHEFSRLSSMRFHSSATRVVSFADFAQFLPRNAYRGYLYRRPVCGYWG